MTPAQNALIDFLCAQPAEDILTQDEQDAIRALLAERDQWQQQAEANLHLNDALASLLEEHRQQYADKCLQTIALAERVKKADLQLSRILHEMAGAVSLCWNPTPTGVFDSTQAIEFVADAIAEIRAYLSPERAQPARDELEDAARLAQRAMHWHDWHKCSDKGSLEARASDALDAALSAQPAPGKDEEHGK